MREMKEINKEVKLEWVAAYEGIEGNECADIMAKMASLYDWIPPILLHKVKSRKRWKFM